MARMEKKIRIDVNQEEIRDLLEELMAGNYLVNHFLKELLQDEEIFNYSISVKMDDINTIYFECEED